MEGRRRREFLAAGAGAAFGAAAIVLVQQWVSGQGTASRAQPASGASTMGAPSVAAPSETSDRAWQTANANLAEQVKETQRRLEQNEAEKKVLEHALKEAEAKLAAAEGDGATPRNPFDLTQDDWKELAKQHEVKARYPCDLDPEWHISPAQRDALGLSPQEAAEVERVFLDEEDRLASVMQPGCAKVVGSAELARRLGNRVCESVLMNSKKDPNTDIQLVADIRAGNVPMPPPEKIDPYVAMMLAQTESESRLQAALTPTFGPEEAHRIAFADELGSCSGTSGGGPPPKF
jgi:hypothetical protein